jgi:hypothetical protein
MQLFGKRPQGKTAISGIFHACVKWHAKIESDLGIALRSGENSKRRAAQGGHVLSIVFQVGETSFGAS